MRTFLGLRRVVLFFFFCVLFSCFVFHSVTDAQSKEEELERVAILLDEGEKRYERADFHGAIRQWEAALTILEKLGIKQVIGLTTGSLGLAYSDLGDFQKAISCYEQAITVSKEIGVFYGWLEGNLGDAYFALDRDDEAFTFYTKHNHPIRLGRYHLKKKDFQKAKTEFDREREQDEQRKEASRIIPKWIGLGACP